MRDLKEQKKERMDTYICRQPTELQFLPSRISCPPPPTCVDALEGRVAPTMTKMPTHPTRVYVSAALGNRLVSDVRRYAGGGGRSNCVPTTATWTLLAD